MMICLTIVLVALFSLPVSAVTFDKHVITPDANWLIHIDAKELRKTGLYEHFVNKEFREEFDKLDQEMMKELDMDLRKNVTSITVFGNGNMKSDLAVHMLGKFNEKKMVKSLKKKGGDFFTTSRYGKYKVYKMKRDACAAFVKGGFVFANSEKRLKVVLDRLKNRSGAKAALLKRVDSIPANAFFMAVADDLSELAGMHSKAVMLQKADVATFMAAEKNKNFSMNLSLQTKSEETANQLEQILRGVIAFGAMNNEHLKEFEDVIKSLQVSRTGKVLAVNFSMPSDKIVEMIKEKIAKRHSRKCSGCKKKH